MTPQLQIHESKLLLHGSSLAVGPNCCASCSPFSNQCADCAGTMPSAYKVVLSGIVTRNPQVSGDCQDCTPINGIYIVTPNFPTFAGCSDADKCNYCVQFDNSARWPDPNPFCPFQTCTVCFESNPAYILINLTEDTCDAQFGNTQLTFALENPSSNCGSYSNLDIPYIGFGNLCDMSGASCKLTAL